MGGSYGRNGTCSSQHEKAPSSSVRRCGFVDLFVNEGDRARFLLARLRWKAEQKMHEDVRQLRPY